MKQKIAAVLEIEVWKFCHPNSKTNTMYGNFLDSSCHLIDLHFFICWELALLLVVNAYLLMLFGTWQETSPASLLKMWSKVIPVASFSAIGERDNPSFSVDWWRSILWGGDGYKFYQSSTTSESHTQEIMIHSCLRKARWIKLAWKLNPIWWSLLLFDAVTSFLNWHWWISAWLIFQVDAFNFHEPSLGQNLML